MVVGHITLTFAPDASEDDAEDITQNFACQIMSHPFVQNVKAETGKFERRNADMVPGQMTVEDLLAS